MVDVPTMTRPTEFPLLDFKEETMKEFQERVVEEKKQLDEKRHTLEQFFTSSLFRELDQAEKDRLRTHHSVMGVYSEIQHQRISAFN